MGITVGAFTAGSLMKLQERGGSPVIGIGNAPLLGTLAMELLLALLLVPFLRIRGWRLSDLTASPAARDLVRGIGVWALAYLAYAVVWIVVATLQPQAAMDMSGMRFAGTVSWALVLLVTAVNPVFEEFLFLGYTVSALSRYGIIVAGIASVGLRALVHLYQGPLTLVAVAPVGAVFLQSYLRRRSLWPAVLAHMVFDAVGLMLLARTGGAA